MYCIVQILFVFRLPVVLVGNNMHVRGFAGNFHIICALTLWVNVATYQNPQYITKFIATCQLSILYIFARYSHLLQWLFSISQ